MSLKTKTFLALPAGLFLLILLGYSFLFPFQKPYEKESADRQTCRSNRDCILVDSSCCGCQAGGKSIVIHRAFKKSYKENLKASCSEPRRCLAWYRCDELVPKCENSKCVTVFKPSNFSL